MTTVLIVDDQELVRAGFRVILQSEPTIEVIGEASNGNDAIRLARELSPDVICMDIEMPELDGLAAARVIVDDPEVSSTILMLTTFDRDDYLFEALAAGASGFLLKSASPEQLIDAVSLLARGDAVLAPAVTSRVLARFSTTPSRSPNALPELTARETDVLTLVAQGMSNAEIAQSLFLGEATVKTHVSNLLMKLGVRDRIQAVVQAYERGFTVPGTTVPPHDGE